MQGDIVKELRAKLLKEREQNALLQEENANLKKKVAQQKKQFKVFARDYEKFKDIFEE